MKARSLAVALFAALSLALAGLAAGCGEGERQLSLEEYVSAVDAAQDTARQRFAQLESQLNSGGSGDQSARKARKVASGLTQMLDAMRQELEGLRPPEEAQSAHGRLLDSVAQFVKLAEEAEARSKTARTAEEIAQLARDLFGEKRAAAVWRGYQGACQSLQGLAGEQEIDIDLDCARQLVAWPLSLKEYFQRLEAIFARARESTAEITGRLDQDLQPGGTTDEKKLAVRDFLNRTVSTFRVAVGDLEKLTAPSTAHPAHQAFVSATSELIELTAAFRATLLSTETLGGARNAVNEFDSDSRKAIKRGDDACRQLQSIADRNRISVDLDCGT